MAIALSPSRLDTWESCPRRFWYAVIERVPSVGWAHLSLGNAVHRALRDWWDAPPAARTTSRVDALVGQHWRSAGFRDEAQEAQWRTVAASMVWRYVQALDATWQPFGCERSLGAMIAGAPVNGQIDRLDPDPADPQALVVVDYKTGSSVPSGDIARSSRALVLYAHFVERALGRRCTRVELHHVPSGQVAAWVHTPDTMARHLSRASDLIGEVTNAVLRWRGGQCDASALDQLFPPQPGPLCGYCDAWARCAVGQAATARRQPWDGLADSP